MSIFDFIPGLNTLLDRLIPDKAAAAKAKMELELMASKGELDLLVKQLEVNKEEAKHSSIFVAGARPAILWICGITFGYHYLIYPIIQTLSALYGFDVSQLPVFDTGALWPVLGGLLGLSGMRSYDKVKGTIRNSL